MPTFSSLARAVAGCALIMGAANAEPLKLSLRDAVNLALKQNPRVLIASLDLADSEQDSRIARSGLLPQAGIQAQQVVTRANVEAAFGQRIPGFPQHIGPYWTTQIGPGATAPLFDLTLWHRYKASKQLVEGSRAARFSVREQAVLMVVSQYLGCQRAAADVEAAGSRVKLAQALYDQANDLQQAGVGTGIDTLRANVQLQNEKQRLIIANTELETSLYGLARLLNLTPTQSIEIADQVNFFDTPSYPADETLEKAWGARPEMRQVQSAQEAARLARQAAGEARLPTLRFQGGWSYWGLSDSTLIPTYQYGFTLAVPLFTGGRIGAEQTKYDLAFRKLQQQETDLRNAITLEVRTALARLQAARNEVDVANLGVKLATQEVDQARDRFRAGVANNIEVITAQNELARANDNQIGALYRYNQSRADLAHATGRTEAMYAR